MKLGSRESGIGNRQSRIGLRQRDPHGARQAVVRNAARTAFPHARFPIHHSRRASRAAGFSLLEVIAAIMLLAIAFTALMKVAGASISLTHNAAEYSEAAMRARSLLDSAFVGEPVRPGHRSGRFDQRYRWQLDVSPWNQAGAATPGAPLQLYQLDLTVSWGPPAHPRSTHFRTLRLGTPNLAGSAQASR
jgi:general secretion pathway protein I